MLFCAMSVMAFALVASVPASGQSHWKIVFSQQSGSMIRASYFLNESLGWIGGVLDQGIYKTTNGGQTWLHYALPPNSDGSRPQHAITSIYMSDALHGWLTAEPIVTAGTGVLYPGLYRTTDGGQTWKPASTSESATAVYQTPSALIVSTRFGNGESSFDGGVTFQPSFDTTNGLAFVDNLHGVATGYEHSEWHYTSDGGRSWNFLSPDDTSESWGVYGVKGTSWFFAAPENDRLFPLPNTRIRWSSDFGKTWNAGTQLSFHTTGDLEGFGFTLYVQDTNTGSLYRSKDSGKTWTNVGGPLISRHLNGDIVHILDTRFTVTGCRGEVIYAFDDAGNVYKSIDGGDGSMPQFALPASMLQVDSIGVCAPRDTTIWLRNLSCDTAIVLSATSPPVPTLDLFDPKTNAPLMFPVTLLPTDSIALKLELTANTSGIYSSKVFLELEGGGSISYDTILVKSALAFFNPLKLVATAKYDSTALCQSRDTVLTIANDSCFSVQLISSQMKSGTNFLLDTVFTNDSIPSHSSKHFSIRFAPSKIGTLADSLILNVNILGKAVRLAYSVSGIGKSDNPQLVLRDRYGNRMPNEIDLDTITRCDSSLFAFTIIEQGCDKLFVTAQWLDSTKTKNPPFSQFRWLPFSQWITSDDTVKEGILALPLVLGNYQGYLKITDSLPGAPANQVSMIPYSVFVKPGTKTMLLDTAPRVFDSIRFCDSRDTIVPITNLGCDTIHVDSLAITGTTFYIAGGPKAPFVVNPGSTAYDTIAFVPQFSGPVSDTLTIKTDADTAPNRTIVLSGFTIPTDTILFRALATNTIVSPGDTTTVYITAGSKFVDVGLNAMKIVLEYNSDVMSPETSWVPQSGMSGSPEISLAPEQLTITRMRILPIFINGANMTFDSGTSILALKFIVTLSDTTLTDFHITQFQLNNGDYRFNKCLLGSSVDTGSITLQFLCGDSLIYNALRYGTIWSPDYGIVPKPEAARPDPLTAASTLTIPFTAVRAVVVKLDILDALGTIVYSDAMQCQSAGASAFTLSAKAIPSGAYHYRLHTLDGGTGVASGSFVVIK
jgi:photosystem II stability/assembly factor-like uncharacterized protein